MWLFCCGGKKENGKTNLRRYVMHSGLASILTWQLAVALVTISVQTSQGGFLDVNPCFLKSHRISYLLWCHQNQSRSTLWMTVDTIWPCFYGTDQTEPDFQNAIVLLQSASCGGWEEILLLGVWVAPQCSWGCSCKRDSTSSPCWRRAQAGIWLWSIFFTSLLVKIAVMWSTPQPHSAFFEYEIFISCPEEHKIK